MEDMSHYPESLEHFPRVATLTLLARVLARAGGPREMLDAPRMVWSKVFLNLVVFGPVDLEHVREFDTDMSRVRRGLQDRVGIDPIVGEHMMGYALMPSVLGAAGHPPKPDEWREPASDDTRLGTRCPAPVRGPDQMASVERGREGRDFLEGNVALFDHALGAEGP